MTLIVNLFGGPNAGKSTLAHMVMAHMKAMGSTVSVEMASEVAKELVFEQRARALAVQEYILGEQRLRLERLIGRVDVVVTDSPIVNSAIYLPQGYPPAFVEFVLWAARRHPSLDVFVDRLLQPYDPVGRYHTEEEALVLDQKILSFLTKYGFGPIHFAKPTLDDAENLAKSILTMVQKSPEPAPLERGEWSKNLP